MATIGLVCEIEEVLKLTSSVVIIDSRDESGSIPENPEPDPSSVGDGEGCGIEVEERTVVDVYMKEETTTGVLMSDVIGISSVSVVSAVVVPGNDNKESDGVKVTKWVLAVLGGKENVAVTNVLAELGTLDAVVSEVVTASDEDIPLAVKLKSVTLDGTMDAENNDWELEGDGNSGVISEDWVALGNGVCAIVVT